MINFKEALGASSEADDDILTFYIPTKNANGGDVVYQPWVSKAENLLCDLGGGATTLPPVSGSWKNPETNEIIKENIYMVYSFVSGDKIEEHVSAIKDFLHSMGRELDQGEIVVEISGRLYKIKQYT
ncbi:hypothetical protein AAJCM20276_04880 [Acetobacter aceti]|uniref:Uncharacterized protein n=1 Tax=Acetobacter aceti TaxID=435 RepID=A0A6S6PKU4_ACEAC|nr:hypothetical protein [Acetobacter aceti]BCI65864.1 hypothetical protein AAJCM20276_04880 [Acetobacter aceti]